MRKKKIAGIAGVCAAVMLISTNFGFAADTNTVVTAADTANAAETQKVEKAAVGKISLSLDGAYKQVEKSPSWELMNMENQEDIIASRKVAENISSASRNGEGKKINDSYELRKLRLSKDFAKEILEPNISARKNAVRLETYKQYFSLKNAENQVNISKESYEVRKKIAEIAKKQYEVGKISKNEKEATVIAVTEALNNLSDAENKLKLQRMEFNKHMGYALNQELTLTDTIKENPLPAMTEDEAVKTALSKRLELKAAAYKTATAEVSMLDFVAYPKTSVAYLAAKMAVDKAKLEEKNVPYTVEIDVRSKYMDVKKGYAKLQADKANVANLSSGLQIQQTKYASGMCTITDVNQKAVELYNGKLQQANDMLEYQIALEQFQHSIGTGIDAAQL